MTVGEVRTEASTSSPPTASALRVVLAACAAGVAPVVAGYLWMAVTGGGSTVEGFGFLALTILWLVGGVVLIRLLRVRSLWLGVLVMLLPAVGALVDGAPLGTIFSLGLGLAIGAIAMRGKRMLAVPRVANRVILIVSLVVGVGVVAASLPFSAEDATKGATSEAVIAKTDGRLHGSVYMLAPSEQVTGPVGRGFDLFHARRSGWRWGLAPAEHVYDPLAEEVWVAQTGAVPTDPWGAVTGPAAYVPNDCARPRVLLLTWVEMQGNCWLPRLGLIVGAAPARATILETTSLGGVTQRREIGPVHGFGPAFVSRVYGRDLAQAKDAEPVRFAFRDDRGSLLDARPSMRVAYSWYGFVGRLVSNQMCIFVSIDPSRRVCRPHAAGLGHNQAYDAAVSLALLSPQEYRDLCRQEPPAGDWVLVARVDTKPRTIGIDEAAGRAFRPVSPTQVVVGVRQSGPFEQWLDRASVRVSRSDACFPGPSAEPDLKP